MKQTQDQSKKKTVYPSFYLGFHLLKEKDLLDKPNQQENLDIFNQGDQEQTKKSAYPCLTKFLDSTFFGIIVNLLTLYALFGDDIRVIAFTKSADIVFDILTIIALVVFLTEVILAFITRPDYRWSFFFWLDAISTISLILDIQLISNLIFFGGNATKTAKLARAGRASRVGTKAGRVVRLVRLIRIVKLYQAASNDQTKGQKSKTDFEKQLEQQMRKRDKKQSTHINKANQNGATESNLNKKPDNTLVANDKQQLSVQAQNNDENEEDKEFKQSRVSKKLSDLTTKRVIIIVLLLLFIMPLFTSDYYFDDPKSLDISLLYLKIVSEFDTFSPTDFNDMFTDIINEHGGMTTPVARLSTPFNACPGLINDFYQNDFDQLRQDEQDFSFASFDPALFFQNNQGNTTLAQIIAAVQVNIDGLTEDDIQFIGIMNTRDTAIQNSGLGIGRTLFVCIVLTVGALMFSQDANDLALRPIERMIDKVNQIAKNPISAKEQKLRQDEEGDQYETTLIENAIIQIGTLLALGFGDAGSQIIAQNMSQSGDVNPMIPGRKLLAIYGFCDIRNFTDATEVLQEEVMLFVNNIGEIVHNMVDRFLGAANQNIGDAFLLVWKIPPYMYHIDQNNDIVYDDAERISLYADLSILSFMQIQAKINREPKVLQYRLDERLNARMANYKVKMGFGLHMGWSIEGAIGSEFQIDASYLSPNVNMASRLEGGTQAYGVPLLISGDLYQHFTESMQKFVRQIDLVSVKGYNYPIGMYTVDMNMSDLPPSKDPTLTNLSAIEKKKIDNLKKEEIINMIDNASLNSDEFIHTNKDLKYIMQKWNQDWQQLFAKGFQHYIKGEWQQAHQVFEECLVKDPSDGPCKALIEFMVEENHFQVPADWKGDRPMPDH